MNVSSAVKQMLVGGELSVRSLIGAPLFEMVGGDKMVAMIDQEHSFERWADLSNELARQALISPVYGILSSLADVIARQEILRMKSAIERLASWAYDHHAQLESPDSREAVGGEYWRQVASLAQRVEQKRLVLIGAYSDRKGYVSMASDDEDANDTWMSYVTEALNFQNFLFKESNDSKARVSLYWYSEFQAAFAEAEKASEV